MKKEGGRGKEGWSGRTESKKWRACNKKEIRGGRRESEEKIAGVNKKAGRGSAKKKVRRGKEGWRGKN